MYFCINNTWHHSQFNNKFFYSPTFLNKTNKQWDVVYLLIYLYSFYLYIYICLSFFLLWFICLFLWFILQAISIILTTCNISKSKPLNDILTQFVCCRIDRLKNNLTTSFFFLKQVDFSTWNYNRNRNYMYVISVLHHDTACWWRIVKNINILYFCIVTKLIKLFCLHCPR